MDRHILNGERDDKSKRLSSWRRTAGVILDLWRLLLLINCQYVLTIAKARPAARSNVLRVHTAHLSTSLNLPSPYCLDHALFEKNYTWYDTKIKECESLNSKRKVVNGFVNEKCSKDEQYHGIQMKFLMKNMLFSNYVLREGTKNLISQHFRTTVKTSKIRKEMREKSIWRNVRETQIYSFLTVA